MGIFCRPEFIDWMGISSGEIVNLFKGQCTFHILYGSNDLQAIHFDEISYIL
jgi:hypothetical protein